MTVRQSCLFVGDKKQPVNVSKNTGFLSLKQEGKSIGLLIGRISVKSVC
ncbi:hypothetical protein CLOSTASPAR_02566 [[Clostridium] asparagiforme DSM 15981]|uniref:Uncharacterized protein n=1 Tax=[Clostridium] asparagiforme DSM 15981 TaxID=518636 RepID=C0CZY6_9FIRM|nr:hypothetical protein CLOSTASPAR_02566 [[Clostridium] asparagiforme DSM 15981]